MLHVRDDPDHGQPRRLFALRNALPDRIAPVGPQRFREGLVDDDDAGLVRAFAALADQLKIRPRFQPMPIDWKYPGDATRFRHDGVRLIPAGAVARLRRGRTCPSGSC